MRWIIVWIGLLVSGGQAASAAELVMFESSGCDWCVMWDEQIGHFYHKTDEGKAAPLRKVDHDTIRGEPFPGIRPIIYTPTFILMDEGKEVGRINGYPGEDHFWGMLGHLIDKLDPVVSQKEVKI